MYSDKRRHLIVFLLLFIFNLSLIINGENLQYNVSEDLCESSDSIEVVWNASWDDTDGDLAHAVATDADGNIYCGGMINKSNWDITLVKFDNDGNLIWNTTWSDPNSSQCFDIAIDLAGYIYCLGNTNSYTTGSTDFLLIKFDFNGNILWNTTWGGPENEFATALAIDYNGIVYCTGQTESYGSVFTDMVLVKFYPDGVIAWNTTWGGNGYDRGEGIAIDPTGNIYCTGYTDSYGSGSDDLFLIKFKSDKTKLWNKTWGDTSSERGHDIAIDSDSNLYCTGYTHSIGSGSFDLLLIKFDSNGMLKWIRTWGDSYEEVGNAITIKSNGNIYCVGYKNILDGLYGLEYDTHMIVAEFNSDGENTCDFMWIDDPNYNNTSYDIVVDENGYIYSLHNVLLEFTFEFKGNIDFEILKLAPNFFPNTPYNPNPENNSIINYTNQVLSVSVSDPDGNKMNVSFYNAVNDNLIGTAYNILSGETALINWTGLNWSTTYTWYAITDDGSNINQSSNWIFTTRDEPMNTQSDNNIPPWGVFLIIIGFIGGILGIGLLIIHYSKK